MKSPAAHDYRPDIDGLRAVAVLAVIVFHMRAAWLPGGFVGVDIFFVISGYLITRYILQELAADSFSLGEFYRRRIKRIAPAMLLVVGATLALSALLMLPEDVRTTAKSAVWSLASLANFYFCLYKDAGYFAAGNENYPLLHLWSLGVEEQFYMLWPLFLMLWRPRSRAAYLLLAGVLAAVSFGGAELLLSSHPDLVYFMLPTRGGELLVGAMLSWPGRPLLKLSPATATPLALCGAALILASLIFLSEGARFPGLLALPPTVGTAMLILAGDRHNPVSALLSRRMPVALGRISYSAYLWHWPLIAFWQYGYGAPGVTQAVILVAATLGLSSLSYRFVEVPARQSKAALLPLAWRQFAMPAGALGLAAVALVYGGRIWPGSLDTPYRRELKRLYTLSEPAFIYPYVCQRQRLSEADTTNTQCVVGDGSGEVKALLWGDSNASHYIGMLGEFAQRFGWRFRNVEVGSCPPLLADPAPFVDERRLEDCRTSQALMHSALTHYEVIILGGTWTSYQARSPHFLAALESTVHDLSRQGKKVILLGKAPEIKGVDRSCQMKALSYPALDCHPLASALKPEIVSMNSSLRDIAARNSHVSYFDANDYLCDKGRCLTQEAEGNLRYYDASHLTMSFSWELGRRIYSAEGVPEVFRNLP